MNALNSNATNNSLQASVSATERLLTQRGVKSGTVTGYIAGGGVRKNTRTVEVQMLNPYPIGGGNRGRMKSRKMCGKKIDEVDILDLTDRQIGT
jgi:hypothetical protein